jgi:predicted CXXCH cytochrome family protein
VKPWRQFLIAAGLTAALAGGAAANAAVTDASSAVRSVGEAWSQASQTPRVANGQQFFGDAQYRSSEVCKACHLEQYKSWQRSWHSRMERWPSPDVVVGDFSDRRIQFRNMRVRTADGKDAQISPQALAFRRGDRFYFTLLDQDDAANHQTHEVAKVLGGKWDQGYEVRLGADNFLPAPLRWSVQRQDWWVGGFNPQDWFVADGTPDGRPLRLDELPRNRVAEAKCNGCHTTGYGYAKSADGVWKSQAKGQGEIAVACESCHGPGSRHVDEARDAERRGVKLAAAQTTIVNPLTDLSAEQSTQVCGQCHGRGTHKNTPDLAFVTGFLPGDLDLGTRFRLWSHSATAARNESDYFWRNDWAARNRQQYQDFTKSGHFARAGMSCVSCHSFHGRTEDAQLRAKPDVLCRDCHRADGKAMRPQTEMYAGSEMDLAGVTCTDCHMARIASRSRATERTGHQWDTSSHVFAVATPAMALRSGMRDACIGCHEGNGRTLPTGAMAEGRTTQAMADDMLQRMKEVRSAVTEVQALLAQPRARRHEVKALVNDAQAQLAFVVMDNSFGVHNLKRTRDLLRQARSLALRANDP